MTVGRISYDLLQKSPESRDPIELERAMQEDYLKHLLECCETHKNIFTDTFFIVIITKNEKLMPNVFRNYFSARISCPTPDYDQTVFAYDRQNDRLQYIWTIPSKDACLHLLSHKDEVVSEEKQLLNFIIQYADGTLFELSKKYNGEQAIGPLLIK